MKKATCYSRLLTFIPIVKKFYADWNIEPPSPFFRVNNIPNEFLTAFFKNNYIIKKRIIKPDNTIYYNYIFNKKTTNNDEEIAKEVYYVYSKKLEDLRNKKKPKNGEPVLKNNSLLDEQNKYLLTINEYFACIKYLSKNDFPNNIIFKLMKLQNIICKEENE